MAAIAAYHAPIAGQSVGRIDLTANFLRGATRLILPSPHNSNLGPIHGPQGSQRSFIQASADGRAMAPFALDCPPAGFGIGQASRRPAGTPVESIEFGPNDGKVVLEPR